MRASADTKLQQRRMQPAPDLSPIRDILAGLLLEATKFVAPARVAELAQSWLPRVETRSMDPLRAMLQAADAFGMAMDLTLFTPSAGGTTASDRLARARRPSEPCRAEALDAIRRAQLRLLRVETVWGNQTVQLHDIVSGEPLLVLDESMPAEAVGVALLGRLAASGDGRHVFVGGVTPLDSVALEVAMGFVGSGTDRQLTNPHRCAEAVYRHVLRRGTLEIPGLNRPLDGEDDDLEGGELDQLAQRWAEPDATHDPDDVQFVREQTSLDGVLDLLGSVANTRAHALGRLSGAYSAIAFLQLETLHRRALAGSGSVSLQTVA